MAERRTRALRLRAGGMSPEDIADVEARETGRRRTPAAVTADIKAALAMLDELALGTGAARTLEAQRLDAAQRAVEAVLRTAQSGRCRMCGRTPEPGLVLRASDRLVRLMERRAVLLGLDVKEQVPEQPDDELEKRRKRLRGQVGG